MFFNQEKIPPTWLCTTCLITEPMIIPPDFSNRKVCNTCGNLMFDNRTGSNTEDFNDVKNELKTIFAPHPKFGNDIYKVPLIILAIFFIGLFLMLSFN